MAVHREPGPRVDSGRHSQKATIHRLAGRAPAGRPIFALIRSFRALSAPPPTTVLAFESQGNGGGGGGVPSAAPPSVESRPKNGVRLRNHRLLQKPDELTARVPFAPEFSRRAVSLRAMCVPVDLRKRAKRRDAQASGPGRRPSYSLGKGPSFSSALFCRGPVTSRLKEKLRAYAPRRKRFCSGVVKKKKSPPLGIFQRVGTGFSPPPPEAVRRSPSDH